jgi:hypothetical protein
MASTCGHNFRKPVASFSAFLTPSCHLRRRKITAPAGASASRWSERNPWGNVRASASAGDAVGIFVCSRARAPWTRHPGVEKGSNPRVITVWLRVRVLPSPPPSPAQMRFPAVSGKTPGFPRHSRGSVRRFRSLRWVRTNRGGKIPPGLWLAQTVSRQILFPRTETGSHIDRDRFAFVAGAHRIPLCLWRHKTVVRCAVVWQRSVKSRRAA